MPPREIRELMVSAETHAKLEIKGIRIEEVRQAVANSSGVRKGPRNQPGQAGRCYFVVGRTDEGRTLKVLVRRFDGGAARLITAWLSEKVG
jgi:hypothetical protein